MVSINPTIVAFITAPTFVPVLTALLTKLGANIKVQLAVVAVVSFVVAAISTFVIPDTGYAVISWESLSSFIITFLLAGQGYDKFWKPILALNTQKLMLPDQGLGGSDGTAGTEPVPQ